MHRFRWLLVLLLLGFARAEEPADQLSQTVRTYKVPYRNGRIESRDVFQKVLEVSGSKVELPENFPNIRLRVNKMGTRLAVMGWNTLLAEYGIRFHARPTAIEFEMDLEKMEASLDEFEEGFTDFFGIDRPWQLHHMTSDGRKAPVVVLLHGLDSSKRFFSGTIQQLSDLGYDVYFFEYPNDDRIVRNARRLSASLQQLPADRRKDISLVTVSMGGLVSQTMIETPELYVPGVKRLIACVPPFQGSELAAMRGLVEVGDQTMNFFDLQKTMAMFNDGMGRAGIDLQPGSLFMQQSDTFKRNPKVTYSILAGSKGMVDPAVLNKAKTLLENSKTHNAVSETVKRISLERLTLFISFQAEGDGAVRLESATLEGVTDRVELPLHHLEILSDLTGKVPSPGLKEVQERLPALKPSTAP